ncbi:ABC transporter permease [Dongia sp.]|uniref:ABC transporter permease n=1 Tax=Dongia sp. TaxID=1977262 RepID=UPI0037537888
MTDLALHLRTLPRFRFGMLWAALALIALVLWLQPDLAAWAVKYPKSAVVPIAAWIGATMKWLIEHFQFLTRGLAAVIDIPLQVAFAVLAKGFSVAGVEIPRLSWVGVAGAAAIAGYAYGGMRLALVSGICFLYIALFGQWDSAMLTLALVIICVPFGVALGLLFGILAYRSKWLDTWFVRPSLDLAQTIPAFAYLVPILLLFGSGPVPGLVATAIFASPPMVRATKLALEQVSEDIQSFADMAGCTRRQKLWRVMLPTARPMLMIGVNQVIMMTLNMVIISSMIGAGGLGYDVLLALRALKIGAGLEAGLAIVALAIALDRISAAAAVPQVRHAPRAGANLVKRHPYLATAVIWLVLMTLLGLAVPALAKLPKDMTLTTAPFWSSLIEWINVNLFDIIDAARTWLLLNLLNPFKNFLSALPWVVFVAAGTLLGYQLAGWRLAALVGLMLLFPAVTGLWEKTMFTVYLCAISAFIACLIGIPIGAWAARIPSVDRVMSVIDATLQTLPSFVYLIPVVMLFRVGDVTAMIAIVAYAVSFAIYYTTAGIKQVPPDLIEAARAMGCTPRQIQWRVQLPLALPAIMLGINQTVLMALAMLVITAMVGTRDLGQAVFTALAKADGGSGLVAGLAIAFLGIVADRLIVAGAGRMRRRMGLPES